MTRALTSFLLFLFVLYSCSKHTPPVAISFDPVVVDSAYFLGIWSGDLYYNDYHLPYELHISEDNHTINSPAEQISNMSVDSVDYSPTSMILYLGANKFKLSPDGKDKISVLRYNGVDTLSFSLLRNQKISPLHRPQTPPQSSAHYNSSAVRFINNEAQVALSGTVTLPNTPPTSFAILLTGSGPQDRDETILGHKSFAVIADFLTQSGMGVLRYDDRGVGESEGAHSLATSFDFAKDAAAAYRYISSNYPETPIGFIGHSEGGIIAQIADSLVGGAAYHIYLASPGKDITELMKEQNELVLEKMMSAEGLRTYTTGLLPIYKTIISDSPVSEKQARLNELTKALYTSLDPEDAQKLAPSDLIYSMSFAQLLYLKWWPYFLSYRPKQYLAQITCPIFALNGEKDIHVTPENLNVIKSSAYQSQVSTLTLPGTNHLFQCCHTCVIEEYGLLTESFSTDALNIMYAWLGEHEFIAH